MPQKTIQYSKQVRIIRNVSPEARNIIGKILDDFRLAYYKKDLAKLKDALFLLESTSPIISEDILRDILNNIRESLEQQGITIKFGTVQEVLDQIDEYCKNISSKYGISMLRKISICREHGIQLIKIVYRCITKAIGKHNVFAEYKIIRMGFYRPGEEG